MITSQQKKEHNVHFPFIAFFSSFSKPACCLYISNILEKSFLDDISKTWAFKLRPDMKKEKEEMGTFYACLTIWWRLYRKSLNIQGERPVERLEWGSEAAWWNQHVFCGAIALQTP